MGPLFSISNSILYYLLSAAYILLIIFTIARILLDTKTTSKTLGYILLVLIFPLIGVFFYFSFGSNYRHRKSTIEALATKKRLLILLRKW